MAGDDVRPPEPTKVKPMELVGCAQLLCFGVRICFAGVQCPRANTAPGTVDYRHSIEQAQASARGDARPAVS